MKTNDSALEPARITSIIEKRLARAPSEAKTAFPAVLKQERVSWATISELDYLMVVFLTAEDEKRVNECISKRLNPFLGLITTGPQGAAFRVEKSRYMTIKGCNVSNSFALSLGPDSTILLEDHHQLIETNDIGTLTYTVPLAYIISYGDEISHATIYEYLEGLIAYSTNMWREAHG
ncbi:MAG: hypothetical protein KKD92_07360 [Proteobacteria bacterium]|nr:hypothetical protein [Pseudomonadota bacterium]